MPRIAPQASGPLAAITTSAAKGSFRRRTRIPQAIVAKGTTTVLDRILREREKQKGQEDQEAVSGLGARSLLFGCSRSVR